MKKPFVLVLIVLLSLSLAFASPIRDMSEVNAFDRTFINEYNGTLDKTATVLDLAFLTVPVAFALDQDLNETTKIGIMYAETLGAAFIGKEVLKRTIDRPRPYLYTSSVDSNEEEWCQSFPSGHTTAAFATASFTSYVFSRYYPDSKWKLPVTLALYGFALTEGAMRIKSGCHFPTDVLAGAALGTAIGYTIPMLHTLGENTTMSASPFGLLFRLEF